MSGTLTLRQLAVFPPGFDHLYGVVLQVEVDLDGAHPALLQLRVLHTVRVVAAETQHLHTAQRAPITEILKQ